MTLAGNSALRTTAGALPGRGGNLVTAGTVRNTIVAAGTADEAGTEDCIPFGASTSLGGNVVPPSCKPGPSDRATADPKLGPLADNGGGTNTVALLDGSPAIDAAVGCPPPAADQRGVARPVAGGLRLGGLRVELPPTVPIAAPGPPVPRCEGKRATIVGTAGKDRLKGTKRADVIVGLAGADTILAARGQRPGLRRLRQGHSQGRQGERIASSGKRVPTCSAADPAATS